MSMSWTKELGEGRGRKMIVYKQTIKETIELLELITNAKDKTITNEDKKKGVELKIEYKSRLKDVKGE